MRLLKTSIHRSLPGACALLLLLFAGAGCGGSAQEYYRLSAAPAGADHRSGGVHIGVGPISLPAYVDRAELVYQSSDNRFEVPANAHWVGSLRENVARVLADDLGTALHSGRVALYPWPAGAQPDYTVSADIRQFHGISGDDAILEVSWHLKANGHTIRQSRDTLREPIQGDGYNAVVAAESRLLEQFAARIARSIRP